MAKKRIYIPSLDGGEYPEARTSVLEPNQLKHAVNMEVDNIGLLNKRKETDSSWEPSLNTLLGGELGDYDVLDFWLWYPNKLPSDIHEEYDYLVILYYLDGDTHKLSVVYNNGLSLSLFEEYVVTNEDGEPVTAYSGSSDNDSDTVLTDSGASFPTDDSLIGSLIFNTTESSYGVITAHDATTITVDEMEKTNGDVSSWNTSDSYAVYVTTEDVDQTLLYGIGWTGQQIVTNDDGEAVVLYESTATGGTTADILEDDTKTFTSIKSELEGTLIYNTTKGGVGTITNVSGDKITVNSLKTLTGNTVEWESGDDYKIYVTYNATDSLEIGAKPRLYVSADRVLIADGVNENQFIGIDNNNNITTGTLGMPAPLNRIEVDEITDWDDSLFETDATADYLGECGLYQYTYTAVDKNGYESNPAPISDTYDIQFFEIADDGTIERWVDKIKIKNLSVPETDFEIESFNIYRRNLKYSSGLDTEPFRYVQNVKVKSKTTSGITGNDYTDILSNDGGRFPSYENDISPVSKDICQIGGLTFAANNKTKVSFPFEFEYFHKIDLNNPNSETYIDAVIKLRICDSGHSSDYSIDYLDLSNYAEESPVWKLININHIRIYDADLNTPIPVYTSEDDLSSVDSNYIDIYIKIPQLVANENHSIYLVFNSDMDTYNGVDESYCQGAIYGEWTTVKSSQAVFSSGARVNNYSIVTSPMNEKFWDNLPDKNTTVINKANYNYNGTMSNSSFGWGSLAKVIDADVNVGLYNITFDNSEDCYVDYGQVRDGSLSIFTTYFNINFDEANIDKDIGLPPSDNTYYQLAGDMAPIFPSRKTVGWSLCIGYSQLYNYKYFHLILGDADSYYQVVIFDEWDISSEGDLNLFIKLSFNEDEERAHLYCIDNDNGTVKLDQTGNFGTVRDWSTNTEDYSVRLGNGAYDLYYTISNYKNLISIKQAKYDRFQYLLGKEIRDENIIKNIANFRPPFETFVGYNYSTYFNNISFNDTEEVEYEENKNSIKWTNIGGISFPDLYYKELPFNIIRILPAPAFLRDSYKNSVLCFGRNQLSRFIIEGEPDGMADDIGNVIPEKSNYGLVADDSLQIIGNNVFWLSENGIIHWSPERFKSLTSGIIDMPMTNTDSYFSYYSPLRNQYILHWESSEKSGISNSDGTQVVADNNDWYADGFREGDIVKETLSGSNYIIKDISGDTVTFLSGSVRPQREIHLKLYKDYVYHIDYDLFTRFCGLEILSADYLSRSDQDENLNIFLKEGTSNNSLVSYPGDDCTSTYSLITKEIEQYWAQFLQYEVEFSGSAEAKAIVVNPKSSNVSTPSSDTEQIITANTIHLRYNSGNLLRIYLRNTEEIKNMYIDFIERTNRNW